MRFKKGQTIENWFLSFEKKLEVFPNKFDFVTRYKWIRNNLREHVHEHINQGAQHAEYISKSSEKKTLTGHGPKHFDDLIKATTRLVNTKECNLNHYEVYLLLAAIQVHDIGNILGRNNHELSAREVFYDVFANDLTLDNMENAIFLDIAKVHSGENNGDKDTIRTLSDTSYINTDIRITLLAAILRFADELTDNPQRALRYLHEKGKTEAASEIFHIYAYSLKSTEIKTKEKEIKLIYKIDQPAAVKKLQKDSEKQYLLDEIFLRTIKVHTEKTYCMRYMRPYCPIERINVEISVYTKNYRDKILDINYRLIDKGYPDHLKDKKIWEFCEDEKDLIAHNYGNKHWDGKTLRKYLKESLNSDA